MRTNELKEKDFREYVEEYIERVEKAFNNKIKFKDFSQTITDYTEHHIFEFEIDTKAICDGDKEYNLTKEQIEILTEDDDSQPKNQYRIYINSLYIYSTRYQ